MRVFGHGGMVFWMLSSGLFASLYFLVHLLPVLPCRHYVTLPAKVSFYRYVNFLLVLNMVQSVACASLVAGLPDGLCFLNLTTYVYFTAFIPTVYFTFLSGFFSSGAQPTLLFSYKAQVLTSILNKYLIKLHTLHKAKLVPSLRSTTWTTTCPTAASSA